MVHDAALELCENDGERFGRPEGFLESAKENEKLATQLAATIQGRQSDAFHAKAERLRVEIILEKAKGKKEAPQAGDAKKALTLPGTVQAFESIRLYSRVSGFLKTQNVDIGDRVKRGQVLAVVDAPELDAQVRHDEAAVEQAHARILLAKARLEGADGESQLAKAEIAQAEAAVKSAAAMTRFR